MEVKMADLAHLLQYILTKSQFAGKLMISIKA
jgi:hypothetical protein